MRRKVVEQRARVTNAFEALRHQIGLALGAARNARLDAEDALTKLRLEKLVLSVGLDHAEDDPKLAEHRGEPAMASVLSWLHTVRSRFYADWADGPAQLRDLVASEAEGPAGRPAGEWLGTLGRIDGTEPPGLWRIGEATVDGLSVGGTRGTTHSFDVAVPLLDESHLSITSAPKTRHTVDALVENLLMRVLSTFTPGAVKVHLWDVGQLTAVLPNFYALSRTSAVTVHDPTRLVDLLDELAGHIRRIHTHTMQAGYPTLRTMRKATGKRVEPWRIAVLYGNGENLAPELLRDLKRVASGALAAGISLVLVDVPTVLGGSVETISLLDDRRAITSMTGSGVEVWLDPPLPPGQVAGAAARIAEAVITKQGGPRSFSDLLPTEFGKECSARELRAPVGFYEGEPVEVVIGDATPHALIGGPSGSGKTNFLYALLGSLAARYSPDELALYLLDFKEGVSFAGLAPGKKDESWLPHARLVGVNVNTDREFGLALLRFLSDELRRRSAAAKEYEVTNIAELRAADPDGHWPRIVAVIDEFQYLFAGRDSVTAMATALLEDLARRGRSQGIHLVLASQDIAGIDAFWGKPAVFEQCTLRIAMPKARRVLAESNQAAVSAPRWHAVVNHESGVSHGNQLVHVPDSSAKDTFPVLQRQLWQRYATHGGPRLFDGAVAPRLDESPAFTTLEPAKDRPRTLVGQSIEVMDNAHAVELASAPGRNLAVLGSSTAEALSVLEAATRSLARQYPPGAVEFVLGCAIDTCADEVRALADDLAALGHKPLVASASDIPTVVADQADRLSEPDGEPRFVVLYGVDAVLPALERKEPGKPSGLDHLRTLLKQGPVKGTHVLGWWRGVARLKDTLGFGGTEDIGAWVALDVQGSELAAFCAGQVVHWSPRAGRALFFDRSTHASPEVTIPFHRQEVADA
ncbi:FtsK/SpoIIIE domain-containing protein [Saccharomonospora xinjiangensis]|uniref:FtsK/SpoIIIE domain-containing protein n=1 Tax=Saccharomonospora xinjiangensis TaxID=75294 RepID=UPI00106FD567|nr:FtsK/SpoIIIE domain-containing protein [Saccharomonospora xinjiangensis]QBQ62405.1 ESX-1 secretion system protein EccCa1 [Saccharomonospora xinjiangensis]